MEMGWPLYLHKGNKRKKGKIIKWKEGTEIKNLIITVIRVNPSTFLDALYKSALQNPITRGFGGTLSNKIT